MNFVPVRSPFTSPPISLSCSLSNLVEIYSESARVELDDELLADRQGQIFTGGKRGQPPLEIVFVELQPLRDPAPVDGAQALEDPGDLLGAVLDLDLIARAAEERRDVDPVPVDQEVAVAHQLARLGVVGGEPQTVDHVVEPALEELEQVLARHALHPDRLVVVAAELALGQPIESLDLLLLAQLRPVVRQLAPPRLAVLAGRVGATPVAAFVGVAAVPLEEQLHVFAPTKPANRSGVIRHL